MPRGLSENCLVFKVILYPQSIVFLTSCISTSCICKNQNFLLSLQSTVRYRKIVGLVLYCWFRSSSKLKRSDVACSCSRALPLEELSLGEFGRRRTSGYRRCYRSHFILLFISCIIGTRSLYYLCRHRSLVNSHHIDLVYSPILLCSSLLLYLAK